MTTTELVPAGRRDPAQRPVRTVTVTWRLAAGISGVLTNLAEWRGMGVRRSLAMEALLRDDATGGDRARR